MNENFFDSYLSDQCYPMRRVWRALMYTMIVLAVASLVAAWGWKVGDLLAHQEGHGTISTDALAVRECGK